MKKRNGRNDKGIGMKLLAIYVLGMTKVCLQFHLVLLSVIHRSLFVCLFFKVINNRKYLL